MAADSGNATRLAARIIVADSGNVARVAKRIFVADSGNVARLVYTANIGTWNITAGGSGNARGYQNPGGLGTLNSSSFRSGITLMANITNTVASTTNVELGGFAADPGQSYFTSYTSSASGGHTFASSAATYTYIAGGGPGGTGAAIWSWSPNVVSMITTLSYDGTLT